MQIGRFTIEFDDGDCIVTDGTYQVGIIHGVECEEDLADISEEDLIHAFYDEV